MNQFIYLYIYFFLLKYKSVLFLTKMKALSALSSREVLIVRYIKFLSSEECFRTGIGLLLVLWGA